MTERATGIILGFKYGRIRILVVDDQLVSRKKMQRIMVSLGECEEVESGSAAIAAFKKALENETPFDLITLALCLKWTGQKSCILSGE